MKKQLTIKQQRFVKAYIETGNASEAYREAYDAQDMKPESVHVAACNVKHNDKVALRIEEEITKIDKSFIVNKLFISQKAVEKVLNRSQNDEEKENVTLNAAEQLRKNTMSLADIAGLLVDKKLNVNMNANDMIKDNSELAKRLAFLLGQAGAIPVNAE